MKAGRFICLIHLWLRLNGWRRSPATAQHWMKRIGSVAYDVSTEDAVRYELREVRTRKVQALIKAAQLIPPSKRANRRS